LIVSCKTGRKQVDELLVIVVREIGKVRGDSTVQTNTWKDKLKNFLGVSKTNTKNGKPLPAPIQPPAPKVIVPPSTLVADMKTLFQNRQQSCDMEIQVMGTDGQAEKIVAHRAICCRSELLRDFIQQQVY
jgi:hypothetical protein